MNIVPWAGATTQYKRLKVRTSYKSLLLQGRVTFYGEFSLHFRAPHHIFPTYFITESYS